MENNLSIGKIKQLWHDYVHCYKENIMVTNHIHELETLRQPFRLDALTALICIKGSLELNANLKHYKVESNTIGVFFAGDIIQITSYTSPEAYAIVISSDYLNDLHINLKERTSFYLDTKKDALVHPPFEEIRLLKPYYDLFVINIESKRIESLEIIQGLTKAFCYTVISLSHYYREDNTMPSSNSRGQTIFEKFMGLLTIYHKKEHSVKFYANQLCLTPNYLSGVIREYSGKSTIEWITEYVIIEAKILLRNSDMNIQQISYELGFPTQSAFGKYFKQQTGMGPKAYRNGNAIFPINKNSKKASLKQG